MKRKKIIEWLIFFKVLMSIFIIDFIMFKNNLLYCSACSVNLSVKEFANHYNFVHGMISSKIVNNSCYDCNKFFLTYKSFMTHVKSEHSSTENLEIQRENIALSREPVKIKEENKSETINLKKSALHLVAELRSSHRFTGKALGEVTEKIEPFLADLSNYVKVEITKFLNNQPFSKDLFDSEEFKSFMGKFDFTGLFMNMGSLDAQIKAMKEFFTFIDPQSIPFGPRMDLKHDSSIDSHEQKPVYDCFQYVRILETLKLIFSHKEILEYIKAEKDSLDDWLITFRDGDIFKNHPFFKKYIDALRIELFYDEIVVSNSLGGSVILHKLGNVYFTIQNLPEHLKSFLGGIHVVLVAHVADIAKYGVRNFLRPLLIDLKKLESDGGFPVMINGEEIILRGCVTSFCTDGLATYQMFGYLGPSANLFCKLCTIHRIDFKNNDNSLAVLRTEEMYDSDLKKIAEATTQKEKKALMTETGMREECPLNELKYFHCQSNRIFDPMHDGPEGTNMMHLKLVLCHFVTSPAYKIDVPLLNSRLNLFNYGFCETKNKPSCNFDLDRLMDPHSNKLKQKAAQMMCLMRVIPFILSDVVPEGDEYMELILLANRINEFIFAPKLRKSILPYLRDLINEQNNLFFKLFPDKNPINKMHNISEHYVDSIRSAGPTALYNCIRYEAKHLDFKRRGSTCCNYQDIALSTVKMSQIQQSAMWGSGSLKRDKIHFFKEVSSIQLKHTSSFKYMEKLGFTGNTLVKVVDKFKFWGTEYRKKLLLAIDNGVLRDDDTMYFGEIEEIIIMPDEEIYFLCIEWPVEWYEHHLNAHCVQKTEKRRLVNLKNLFDNKPFNLWVDYKFNNNYICLRHVLL